jgi:hypothetical protein
MVTATAKATATAMATAKTTARGASGIHPTHRDVAAMDGHPASEIEHRDCEQNVGILRCAQNGKQICSE